MKPYAPLRLLSACLLAMCALAAQASPPPASTTALTDCVDLSADRQIVRGGSERVFVRNGEAHYKVSFQNSCGSLTYAPRLWISTDGQDNRLCPQGTRVTTGKDSCRVSQVDTISAEEFARRARASR